MLRFALIASTFVLVGCPTGSVAPPASPAPAAALTTPEENPTAEAEPLRPAIRSETVAVAEKESVSLWDTLEVHVQHVVFETYAPHPSAELRESYPAGSGVSVSLGLESAGDAAELLLHESTEPHLSTTSGEWADFRVSLLEVGDQRLPVVRLRVEQLQPVEPPAS